MKNLNIKCFTNVHITCNIGSCDNDYADEKPTITNIAVITNPAFGTLEQQLFSGLR
jgi:hypothetical protein